MIGQAERDILESVIEVTNQPVDKFRFKMDEVEGLRFVYLEKLLTFLLIKIPEASKFIILIKVSRVRCSSRLYKTSDSRLSRSRN